MWFLLPLLAAPSLNWTAGTELKRGNYVLNIQDDILVNLTTTSSPSETHPNINLSGLNLIGINSNVFYNLPNVKYLNLENNNLEHLSLQVLTGLENLETLSLAKNKIHQLNESSITLNHLKCLNLSNNLINSLTEKDLRGLPESVEIIVEGNPLQTLRVNLSGDMSLRSLPVTAWNNLEAYDSELPFSRSSNYKHNEYWSSLDLQTLNLVNRNIEELSPEIFNDLPEFIVIGNLQNNSIKIVEQDVMQNKYLKKICFDYNVISAIEDGAFKGTHLLSLSLRYNHLEDLDFAKSLPISIQDLQLEGNKISRIPNDSLMNLKMLENLVIPSNRISSISVDAFRGLRRLQFIDLSNNLLDNIEPKTFKDQEELSILRLLDNKLKALRPNTFMGLGKLDTLELQANAIRVIEQGSFFGLKNSAIYKVMLSRNQIDTIEEGSFANMTIEALFLNGNQISEESIARGAFESCQLNWLSLRDNLFARINGESFYGILIDNELSLSGNNIKSIGKGTSKYMGGMRSVDLTQNPIERIEKGSLFGAFQGHLTTINLDHGVKIIEGGAFNEI